MTDIGPWVLAVLLGLGLAASTGLNTFLPLLLLALVARFHPLGFDPHLNAQFSWLTGDTVMAALSVATVVEIIADKVPAVDHALHVVATFTRPAAGALAVASVSKNESAGTAALLGIVIGAPTALGYHAVKSGTRATSTITTLGSANPIISFLEDLVSMFMTIVSIVAPWVVPLLLLLSVWFVWKVAKALRHRFAANQPPDAGAGVGARAS